MEASMSFGLYVLGYIVVIIGAAYLMHLAHVPQQWLIGIVVLLLGAGIVTGVSNTRQKDRSE
jgi:protein-S-isoprenylcysteine O-methyltransferase Ste14